MNTRKFDQEWDEKISKINNHKEYNVIFDFYEYLINMNKDFKALKKNYEKEFNKLSNKSLKSYIKLFNKRLEQYGNICIKNYKQLKILGHIQSFEDFRDEIIIKKGNHYKINDKYYRVLNKIANSIFKIEDEMAPVVEKLWQKELTDIKNYSIDNEYFLFAHTSIKSNYEKNMTDEIKEYFNNQKGMCFTAITDKKTRLYAGSKKTYNYYAPTSDGVVGIIAKPKSNGIIGISFNDMISTEYINEKCPLDEVFHHSNVNTCYNDGNSKICCKGTKICPPNEIFNTSADTINEIILDKSKMEITAVFYVKNKRNEIPKHFNKYKQDQEKICGHSLPIIELKQRNNLNQINLDELYSMC